jgi:protein SCO1/2
MNANPETGQQTTRQSRAITSLRIAAIVCLVVLLVATALLVYLTSIAPGGRPGAITEADNSANVLPEHGTPIDPPRPLSDFTLPSQDGTPLSLNMLRGKYVLLFFGYTHCPDVCPTTLADFVQVKRALGVAASQVQFVFISVDGERDTPPVLARFIQNFDASFIGLQGDDTTLSRIGKEYGLYYKKEKVAGTSEPYLVTHSSSAYLLDRQGQLRMVYGFGMPPKVIVEDIGSFLAAD